MRTMKYLMCVACLCSAAEFARTALTQETPAIPQDRELFPEGEDDVVDSLPGLQEPPGSEAGADEQPALRSPQEPRRDRLDPPLDLPIGEDRRTFTDPLDEGQPADDRALLGPVPGKPAQFNSLMRPRRVTRNVVETVYEQIPQEELEASKKLRAAVYSLRKGKDEAARKAAADMIQQQLTAQFERDLKQREKELAEVEQRVKTLREQLDKRKAAQADIINLRLQTLVNEANGLGFPDEDFRTNHPILPSLQFSRPAVRYESVPDSGGSFPASVNEDPFGPRIADPIRNQ